MDKALLLLIGLAEMMRQKFERDETVEFGVLSFVDNTHAAFTELLEDFVMRYGFANHNVRGINKREFGKISEKDLTVKDFSCPEALGGVARDGCLYAVS